MVLEWLFAGRFEELMAKIKKGEIGEEYEHLNYESVREANSDTITHAKAFNALGLEMSSYLKKTYDFMQKKRRTEVLEKLNQSVNNCKTSFDDLEKEMKPRLAELVELGIHNETHRITLVPGLEFDVAVYIKDLCRKYEVNIP